MIRLQHCIIFIPYSFAPAPKETPTRRHGKTFDEWFGEKEQERLIEMKHKREEESENTSDIVSGKTFDQWNAEKKGTFHLRRLS